jgi:hypothetical protein
VSQGWSLERWIPRWEYSLKVQRFKVIPTKYSVILIPTLNYRTLNLEQRESDSRLVLQAVALRYVEKDRTYDDRANGDDQTEGSKLADVAVVP